MTHPTPRLLASTVDFPRNDLAVDIGATTWSIGVTDPAGVRVVARGETCAEPAATVAAIGDAGSALPPPMSVGVSFAGATDSFGEVLGWSNRPAWRGFALAERLRTACRAAGVQIEDDGYAAALGEARLGVARDAVDHLALTLGTGLGGALVVDGVVRRPADRFGLTIGHVRALANGRVCRCARVGCLQTAWATLPAPEPGSAAVAGRSGGRGAESLDWPDGLAAFATIADMVLALGIDVIVASGGLMARRDLRDTVDTWLTARGVRCLVPAEPADSALLGALLLGRGW